jgi:predicted permease
MDNQSAAIQRRQAKLHTTFGTQAKALFKKNATQQKRSLITNLFIVLTPIIFCVFLYVLQRLVNIALDSPENRVRQVYTACSSFLPHHRSLWP